MSTSARDAQLAARRWWILTILGLAQLMVVLDATVVNIALPSAQATLAFSDGDRHWIVTAYVLAFGSLLLLGGRVVDLLGRKPTFIAGLIGFAVASALGGAAQSFAMLVAARALQGVFAALLAPAALSLLTTTFRDADERGKAFGVYGAITAGAGAVGLLVGGVLTETLSWRWTMYVNLALALPAAIGALALLGAHARPARRRIDLLGTLTATTGLFALVFALARAEQDGWSATTTLALLAAGAVLLVVFVALERRVTQPLLPLAIVFERNRGAAFLSLGILGVSMYSAFLFLTFYLQQTLRYSPIETGVAFLPLVGGVLATAAIATRWLVPRLDARVLVAPGMALSAVGLALLAQLEVNSGYAGAVLPGMIVTGAGVGLAMAPAMNIATLGVASADAGVAAALVNTMQQIGASLGIALLSTIAIAAARGYTAGRQPAHDLLAQAAVHGHTTAFSWAAGLFAVGAIACGLLLRGPRPRGEPALA